MAPSRDPGIGSQITTRNIDSAITAAGLAALSAEASDRLLAYLHLLLRWNSRLNLTAVREPSEIIRRHLVESIQCAQSLPPAATLLDFGSGAGLPGIPIAIVRPDIRVTLGESQGKKAAFLREAVRVLSLPSEVYDGRIENMPPSRVFDVVTLRAVDKMAEAFSGRHRKGRSRRLARRVCHIDDGTALTAIAGNRMEPAPANFRSRRWSAAPRPKARCFTWNIL